MVYIEFIEEKKDNLGRQVFFLGLDDDKVEGLIKYQIFNAILQTYIDKWVRRGYGVVFK